jgi:hypothetical protein
MQTTNRDRIKNCYRFHPYPDTARTKPVLPIAPLFKTSHIPDHIQIKEIVTLSYAINDEGNDIDDIIKDINTNENKYVYSLNITFGLYDYCNEKFDETTQEIEISDVYNKIEISTYERNAQESQESHRKDSNDVVYSDYELVGRKNRKLVTDVDLYNCLYKNENNYFYISQTDKRRFVELMNAKYSTGVPTIIQESENEINKRERERQEQQERERQEQQERELGGGSRNKKNNKGMYKVYIENKKLNKYYIKYNNKKYYLTSKNTSVKKNKYYIKVDNTNLHIYF